ncbi:hypothetical protein QJS10_CPA08g01885 [Acorus calamus]|uniref:DUF1764 domain-containing protein n=1 Tax=Acorus calamus TaxID=4465 RepID=A0AAV9EBR0_ACOCL|nr:hypothetical protein QJS10_CPA08g01885 [Acorus calamus]
MATTPKSKRQTPGDEIEEIFSSKKKSKSPDVDEASSSRKESLKPKKKISKDKPTKKKKKKKSSSKGEEGETKVSDRPRRRTGDGLAIYSAEELGFGKSDAGGTPLCPFDCSCCF